MKKTFFQTCLILVILFMSQSSNAQSKTNVTGIWQMNVETSAGSGTPEMELKQLTDSTLAGTYRGQLGETKLSGTIKGDKIYIYFTISDNLIEYEGLLEGDGMKGKVKLGSMGEGTFTGARKK